MAVALHFGRVALAAFVYQCCQLVEDAASVVVGLLRSAKGHKGYFCVEANVRYVLVASVRGGTCLHEALRASVIGCDLLSSRTLVNKSVTYPTRLETRTKESNMYASRRVLNLKAQ